MIKIKQIVLFWLYSTLFGSILLLRHLMFMFLDRLIVSVVDRQRSGLLVSVEKNRKKPKQKWNKRMYHFYIYPNSID